MLGDECRRSDDRAQTDRTSCVKRDNCDKSGGQDNQQEIKLASRECFYRLLTIEGASGTSVAAALAVGFELQLSPNRRPTCVTQVVTTFAFCERLEPSILEEQRSKR